MASRALIDRSLSDRSLSNIGQGDSQAERRLPKAAVTFAVSVLVAAQIGMLAFGGEDKVPVPGYEQGTVTAVAAPAHSPAPGLQTVALTTPAG